MGITSFFVEGGQRCMTSLDIQYMYYIKFKCFVMLYVYIMFLTTMKGYKAVVKHFPKEEPKNSYQKYVRRRQNFFTNVLKSIKRCYTVPKTQ